MSYEHKQGEQSGGVAPSTHSRAPGKVTLTQSLPAAVQRQVPDGSGDAAHVYDSVPESAADGGDDGGGAGASAGDAATADVFSVAAGGVSGSGGALPHGDRIQAAFGRHDVSGVRAHTDSAAAGASAAIGARAYTTGTDIAFGEPSPDLHLIAHEAAHVVQQRSGVSLKGNVGEVGDPYERHADAVADLVVQGKSAEPLLDTMAGGSSAASASVQRKETPAHLRAKQVEANAKIDGIGNEVDKAVKDALGATLVKHVTTARAEALTTAGKLAAEGAIGGATDPDKDVKAQAGKLASGAVAELIKSKSTAIAAEVSSAVKGDATTAARTAINAATPGRVFDTKTADLVSKATTAAKARAAEGADTRLGAAKVKVALPAFISEITDAVKAASRTGATTELALRNTDESKAVLELINDPVEAATGTVHTSVQQYLEEHIGANKTRFFGHEEANAFRKKMKDAAREQAYSDINAIGGTKNFTHHGATPTDKDTHTQERLQNAGEATRNYFVMQGKAQAYDDAKAPVNEYLRGIAHDGTNKILSTAKTSDAITSKASTAAWGVLRDDPDDAAKQAKAAKAALSAATTEATAQKNTLKAAAGPAFTWVHNLLANNKVETEDDDGVTPGELAQGGTTAKAKLKEKVHDENVGSKALQTAIQGETISDGVSKLGALLDLAVPNSGEALKVAVELKIPVPQAPGVFCVLKLEGSAERHQGKDLELGLTFEFGAGWETWGLSLDARLFLFMKARGADTDKACKMLSYGVYRDLCSNPVVPESMATWWATGKAARTGEVSKMEEAETWAAMVEEYAMTGTGSENAFVEAGEGVVGQGKVKAGIVEGQAKLAAQTMRHWDKDTIGATKLGKLDHTGTLAERETKARQKRLAVSGGERRTQWNFETQIDVEAAGQKFGCGLKMQRVTGPVPTDKLGWLDFELIGQLPYDASNPASSTLLSQIAGQYVPNGLTLIRAIYDRVHNSNDPDQGKKSVGTGIDATADALGTIDATGITGNVQKAFADIKMTGAKSDYMNDTIAGELGTTPSQAPDSLVSRHAMKSLLQLSIYRKDGNLGFTLAEVKKLDLGLGDRAGLGASATVSAEKTKKIFSAGADGVNNW